MLIDKRSILKEAMARAAARSIIAAEEEKRTATANKHRHSVGAKRAEKTNDENRGIEIMAKKTAKETAKETVEELKKSAETAVETVETEIAKIPEKTEKVKKAAAAKVTKAKKDIEAKADDVKAAVKKAGTTKKADPKVDVVVEFAGKQIVAKDVKDAVLKAYKKANKGVEIKTVEIYIKPEENAAYYVVNGDAKPEYKVEL